MKRARANTMRWMAMLAAIALLGVAAVLPRGGKQGPLKVALDVWPGVETLIAARERGMLPRTRVHLIDMSWPSAMMRALGNEVVDAAVLSLDDVLRLREGGHEVWVVMVMDVSEGADVVIGSEHVASLAELRGKRVGLDLRSSAMVLLQSALTSAKIDDSEVELVPLSPSEAGGALAEGQVDAVVLADPWAMRVQRVGVRRLFDSKQLRIPLYRVLVVSGKAMKEHQAELRLLLDAHFVIGKELKLAADPEAWEMAQRRERLSLADFQHSLRRVRLLGRDANEHLLKKDGALAAQAKELEQFMREAGLLEELPNQMPWLNGSLLEEAP